MNFKQVREIFIFTRNERNGILLLLFILLIAVSLDLSLPFLFADREYDVTAWREEAEKYYASVPSKAVSEEKVFEGVFDPNSVGPSDLSKMGIPAGIAANWIKYLHKGGHFKKKEEVMKLYGMNFDLYRSVERHLQIPEMSGTSKIIKEQVRQPKIQLSVTSRKDSLWKSLNIRSKDLPLLEVNRADSAQLEALPGIGPVLASRIIRYRKLLGGFYKVSQLKEIYGMSEELWMRSSPRMMVDTSGMKKLEINFLSVAELGRHPYIGFRQAKKIVKRRDSVGKYTSKEELAVLFSTDSLQHLFPYLSISGNGP